ncbi:unnamed protein product [Prunus brigantina]
MQGVPFFCNIRFAVNRSMEGNLMFILPNYFKSGQTEFPSLMGMRIWNYQHLVYSLSPLTRCNLYDITLMTCVKECLWRHAFLVIRLLWRGLT